ncbi:hypothetical protein AB3N59_17205 [Leptospira sp. WS92.C1]
MNKNIQIRIRIFILGLFFLADCNTMLPEKDRIYIGVVSQKGTETLPSWLDHKQKNIGGSVFVSRYGDKEAIVKYYSKRNTGHFRTISYRIEYSI